MNFTQVVPLVHLGQDTVPAVQLVGVGPKQELALTVLASRHKPECATQSNVCQFIQTHIIHQNTRVCIS